MVRIKRPTIALTCGNDCRKQRRAVASVPGAAFCFRTHNGNHRKRRARNVAGREGTHKTCGLCNIRHRRNREKPGHWLPRGGLPRIVERVVRDTIKHAAVAVALAKLAMPPPRPDFRKKRALRSPGLPPGSRCRLTRSYRFRNQATGRYQPEPLARRASRVSRRAG